MEDKLLKYAKLLLNKCINLKNGQPLLIYYPIECDGFAKMVAEEARKMGSSDIYFDPYDDMVKRKQLLTLSDEEIKKSEIFNKEKWNEYALKTAGILILLGDDPDAMEGVSPEKIKLAIKTVSESKKVYRDKQNKNEVAWCIGAVATEAWAKKVFNNNDNSLEMLWNAIFDICFINTDNPIHNWTNFFAKTRERWIKLNNYKFKEFHYTNSLGTNLHIEYSKDTIWAGGEEELKDGTIVVMNMPTIEVFTSPLYNKTNGIVYSSKPLVYNGSIIDKFYIEFKDGKVVNYDAEVGKEVLKTIIDTDDNSCYLGETALVEYDSAISASNILFYETLYDENASCHLALGAGFASAIENGIYNTDEELLERGINVSKAHVDFMIGTNDLNIVGTTYDNKKIQVFKDGKFSLEEI